MSIVYQIIYYLIFTLFIVLIKNKAKPKLKRYSYKEPKIVGIDLTDDLAVKGGDVCGGKLSVFVEPFL